MLSQANSNFLYGQTVYIHEEGSKLIFAARYIHSAELESGESYCVWCFPSLGEFEVSKLSAVFATKEEAQAHRDEVAA